ncbi:MAG: pyrroline-5-carboxylate reductase [Rubrivivax sp.]|nr:pyrroline-5-carboxylate reductase [Rubrivivax sp.]
MSHTPLAFIGGGNMASALIGGLVRSGHPPAALVVVEPHAPQREKLRSEFGVQALEAVQPEALRAASVVVWAVKPQSFAEAAQPCRGAVSQALHVSVMAGIRSGTIAAATGARRIVRAMPNTPALIGRGIAGLHAQPEVGADERQLVERLLAPTGSVLWIDREEQLDAVTAVSGSGPAYVFYVLEAMMQAGVELGLTEADARQLAQATFDGAAALATASPLHPRELRAQVTSKGGTTAAAVAVLDAHAVQAAFVAALKAAQHRAAEMADQLGR